MVKQPEHLEQKQTNNIDEMEILLRQIEGTGSGNGGNDAPVGSISGNGARINKSSVNQGVKDTTNKAEEMDEDETEGNLTRLVEKLE